MFPYGDTDDDQEDENSNEMDKDLHLLEHPSQSGTIDQIDSVLMRHDLGTYLILNIYWTVNTYVSIKNKIKCIYNFSGVDLALDRTKVLYITINDYFFVKKFFGEKNYFLGLVKICQGRSVLCGKTYKFGNGLG